MTGQDPDLDPKLATGLEPSVVDALAEWQGSTGIRLELETWLTAGHTTAKVAVVVATGNCPPTKVILKACPPDRLTSREPRLHAQALVDSPKGFSNDHLVEQLFDTVESPDKWRILFQAIAGDSLRTVRPLESVLDDDRLPELVEFVAASLLNDWNHDFSTRQLTPAELLRSELGSKADRNGPLLQFLKELDLNAEWLRFSLNPGRVVPNAIQWALEADTWPENTPPIWALFGRTHGDLHPGNVLIRVQPTPSARDFRLIDLSDFRPLGSLASDLTHLLLSIVGSQLPDSPGRRRDLLKIALEESPTVPLELRGLREVASRLRQAGRNWHSSSTQGLQDDWEDQFSLALVTEALQFVGRRSLPLEHRLWFFQLASCALGSFLEDRQVAKIPGDPADVHLLGNHIDQSTEEALEQVLNACGQFSGTHATIAILTQSLSPQANDRVGDPQWSTVMSFDPGLDEPGGALAIAREKNRRLHRLVTAGQVAEYGQGSTTWHALGGLADQGDSVLAEGLRPWRRSYMRTIEQSLAELGRFTSRPVTVVIFGTPDDRVRAVVEAVDDRFVTRSKIVVVSESKGSLNDFVDIHLTVNPELLLGALPRQETQLTRVSTVPGHEGEVRLSQQDEEWIREMADLVTADSGTSADGIDDVGRGFLRGRAVSWFELSLNVDVVPSMASDLDARVREDLASRDTRRIALLHYPGAGGTTLSRRVAWQAHLDYPTLYCPGAHDEIGLSRRVERLAQLTGLPVLLVLEQATDVVADRLYNRLRSDSVPVVIVVVSRRAHAPKNPGTRSFYLGYASTRAELARLTDRYAEYAPDRRAEFNTVREGTPSAVPFLFGLLAFQEQYSGLEDYVEHSLTGLSNQEQFIVQVVALSHRYAGISIAEDMFANVLSMSPDSPVDLSLALSSDARALLIEDGTGFWRTAHWLVAAEVLRRQLSHDDSDRDAWKLALSSLALRVIEEAHGVFGMDPPDDIRDLLKRLFIVRENRELYGDARLRSFSELLEEIPSLEGRLEVLRQLAEHFSNEPHFWAHYGRLLSYAAGDTTAAMDAVNKALSLDDQNSVFYHIRGMVYLRRIRDLRMPMTATLDEQQLLRLTELALSDFANAANLDDDDEYPLVATAQVAIEAIEMAYKASGSDSHAAFLARPSSSAYRSLLDQAEDAIGSIAEIRGPDPFSARAEEARVSLNALYDDYAALLQGWRSLLDRTDVLKSPVRRQLVHAYVRRAGDWSQMGGDDQQRVLTLLEENLRDDPTDAASLRDWLRAARQGSVSLDRASELVSYWAQHTQERDALYYDYVMAVLQVLNGRESNWREARRKIDRCRDRAVSFGNRKFSYEWLGDGNALDMLIHYSALPASWDRNRPDDIPRVLRRIPARVGSINSPQAGILRLEPGGLEAFFVPARSGALRGRHENARAEAVIGFSYDGLRAWSVKLNVTGSEAHGLG